MIVCMKNSETSNSFLRKYISSMKISVFELVNKYVLYLESLNILAFSLLFQCNSYCIIQFFKVPFKF